MNHTTTPDLPTRPGERAIPTHSAELTDAELDGVTGAAISAVTRVTSTVIRPTSQPTGTGAPGTSQDTQTDKPFQPQTAPR